MVFGFVVARFGITLREFLRMQGNAERQSGMSLAIGVGFIVMGIFMALVSLVRYPTTMNRLNARSRMPIRARGLQPGATAASCIPPWRFPGPNRASRNLDNISNRNHNKLCEKHGYAIFSQENPVFLA